jgi:hypothetical protein
VALVTPQNWLFLTSYAKFKERLLLSVQWDFLARLGEHAFESSAAAGAFAAMIGLTHSVPQLDHTFAGWDAVGLKTPAEKAAQLHESVSERFSPASFEPSSSKSLRRFARCYQGMSTGDNNRFVAFFWEHRSEDSLYVQTPSSLTALVSGRDSIVSPVVLEPDFHDGAIRGRDAWGKSGVAIARIRSLSASLYNGQLFVNTLPVIIPDNPEHLPAIWAFASSGEFRDAVKSVSDALSVDNGYLEKIPFDLEKWQRVAIEKYPDGLPLPFSEDPTQWVFNGHPEGSEHPLQVAMARVVGYSWPRQTGASFLDCPALGPDGLDIHTAPDGIVCLSRVAGEENAGTRLRALLQAAFGEDYNITNLLAGKKSSTLEDWLRDEFFEEHCLIFQQRPFVWHIWDGLKDGFHALVNYHKLDHGNLEKLIFSYLGDWLTRTLVLLPPSIFRPS